MKIEWRVASYRIYQHDAGKISKTWVSGVVASGFGVHETNGGWSVTHLGNGWNAFTCESAYGAQTVAEYLIENYHADFARLKISGTRVENFRPLENKVQADEKLWRLRRVLCISRRELKQMGAPQQPELEVVS